MVFGGIKQPFVNLNNNIMKATIADWVKWFHVMKHNNLLHVGYNITEPWFRIKSFQIWRTAKISCTCGKVFYDIDNEMI